VALPACVVERPPLVLAALEPALDPVPLPVLPIDAVLPVEPDDPEPPLAELPLPPVAEPLVRDVSFPTLLFDSMNYPPCRITWFKG
jgi:hypothetical protein